MDPQDREKVELGYRRLTRRNWRSPDPTSARAFMEVDDDLLFPSADDWAEMFLDVRLATHVPENVQSLFGVARAIMAYGYFFYPLYLVGLEQMFRVADAATVAKCKELQAPLLRDFGRRLDWLKSHDAMPAGDADWWELVRRFRNTGSHPQEHRAMPPATALRLARKAAEAIDSLFPTVSI